jgi:hypothetical protein
MMNSWAFAIPCHAERSRSIRVERIGRRSRSTPTFTRGLKSAGIRFVDASGIGNSSPQGLKPESFTALIGTAEAAPCPKESAQ